MKKKVAVFANGWSSDYIQKVTKGMHEYAKNNNTDIFVYINYSSHGETREHNIGDANIFRLPDLRDYNGVVLMANSFNFYEEIEYLNNEIAKCGVPAVSLEYELDGVTSIVTDTYSGMYELAEHVISEHGVRNIVYIGGTKNHPDTIIRLKAVRDVMVEFGLVLSETNVIYGEWSAEGAVECFSRYVEERGLPEAVLCANDVMSCGLLEWMQENEYNVPKDIIVTGYDGIRAGQLNYPTMTTVMPDWVNMGSMAMEILEGKCNGKTYDDVIKLKSRFIPGESCGCERDEESHSKLRKECAELKIDGLRSDSHFRHLYNYVRRVNEPIEMSNSLSEFFHREHWMVGGDFMFCLEPEYFEIVDNDENLKTYGYSDNIYVICCLDNEVKREYRTMGTKDAVFFYANNREKPGVYVYVTVYNESRTYGFAMVGRGIELLEDRFLYIWTKHINQELERVRSNIKINNLTKKLTELSVTDMLTGVYNRAGCERIMYPMLNRYKKEGMLCAIMMIDVDRLKLINDVYGHASGDLAICTVAKIVKEVMPDEWIVSRYGGDEFIAGGACHDENEIKEEIKKIEKRINEEVESKNMPFILTASVGYVMFGPESDMDIEKSIHIADENMYEIKQAHHKNADKNSKMEKGQ